MKIQEIADKIGSSQEITENEKFTFCAFYMNAQGEKLAHINSLCEQYFFYNNYLLLLNGKITNQPISRSLPNGDVYMLESREYTSMMFNITSTVKNWEALLVNNSEKDHLISIAKSELQNDIKYFKRSNKDFNNKFLYGGRNKFESDMEYILMRNLFVYLKVKLFLESISEEKRSLKLNGLNIFLDEESLFHIINRHYGELTKPYKSSKTYHTLDFKMDYLHLDIQNIFNLIEKAELISDKEINNVVFKYNDVVYIIVLEDMKEGKKRIKTFYPVDSNIKMKEIEANYILHHISDELEVYIKK